MENSMKASLEKLTTRNEEAEEELRSRLMIAEASAASESSSSAPPVPDLKIVKEKVKKQMTTAATSGQRVSKKKWQKEKITADDLLWQGWPQLPATVPLWRAVAPAPVPPGREHPHLPSSKTSRKTPTRTSAHCTLSLPRPGMLPMTSAICSSKSLAWKTCALIRSCRCCLGQCPLRSSKITTSLSSIAENGLGLKWRKKEKGSATNLLNTGTSSTSKQPRRKRCNPGSAGIFGKQHVRKTALIIATWTGPDS